MSSLEKLANSLTSEQYLKLVEIAHGPLDPEFANISTDELLAELEA